MKKFRTTDYDANNQFQVPLPAGNYRGIGLSWEFTNLAGQSLTLAELGFVRLYAPDGGKLWDVTLERLYGYVRRKLSGIQRTSTPAGAAGEHFIYIPFHTNGDGNIVRLGDGYVMEFQHNDITGDTTTANLTLMLQSGLGVQRYFPLYNDFNIRSLSAEVTPEAYPRKNIAAVAVVPTANITVLKFEKDGNLIYDVTDEQADHVVNIEQSAETFLAGADAQSPWVFDFYKDKNLTEVLGTQYKFGAVSTDATITGLDVQFVLSDAALDATAQVLNMVKSRNARSQAERIVA